MAKVMKLIDAPTGLMECKVCGARHWANLRSGGSGAPSRYYRGSWQCQHGCQLPPRGDSISRRRPSRPRVYADHE